MGLNFLPSGLGMERYSLKISSVLFLILDLGFLALAVAPVPLLNEPAPLPR